MQEFDLFEELMYFKETEKVFALCFSKKHCFERLTRQLEGWQLDMILTHWLAVGRDDYLRGRMLQDLGNAES